MASQLTMSQLAHVLGIDLGAADEADLKTQLFHAQYALLDKIVERRRMFAIDLLRMPLNDLVEQIRVDTNGKYPDIAALQTILAKYIFERTD